jgi:hypothetical protein
MGWGSLGAGGGAWASSSGARPEFFPFAIHNVMNPVIEVDGDHATAQWYLLQPATMAKGGQAVWLSAGYQDQYVRVGGKWMLQHLKGTANSLTPYQRPGRSNDSSETCPSPPGGGQRLKCRFPNRR